MRCNGLRYFLILDSTKLMELPVDVGDVPSPSITSEDRPVKSGAMGEKC
jgi:hypothetical protein